ncbi:bifunctional adenosylcobinamide kinase/adenosylcobinamide-phosphate guanylyltransferase [Desulfovibrio subterraneus]|jgi:adenosylcobinamide kinase/adenosylcobinamide-phosphate guanylyltransferase|uniref:bifunctional adenosylcobinamide kinase/adenosylcobinamide-phosphate guanylyltransferase n=1 Tax=Desulfovibrio subterraneus TaxID=2718620 RepID=UPI0022B8C9B8|nr:bifunctional adenosylcobinamide kinase/adenosylcobinamide-phosphate guanylyltransferase [Desulfovibrio subterraneus]WBF69166.1 bifunctional adenosylcobinamide kinase/adenosylcobinamide-phosphate guanylyltransferase [Desulfovibrio subterraneus]
MIRLILGGDKSGKSAYGLQVFEEGAGPRLLLATGQAQDFAFRRQILDHRTARKPEIQVRETGADMVPALQEAASRYRSILVDSLDFWLFACGSDRAAANGHAGHVQSLLACLKLMPRETDVTFVSCEAGLGAIPASAEVRRFVRELGALNQAVAAASDEVCLMVAGLPLYLKRS